MADALDAPPSTRVLGATTARERMLEDRMRALERELFDLKNAPSSETCLGVRLDHTEMRRVSEEVVASIREDMVVSDASSKRVSSGFIRDKILKSVGIHVKWEVMNLWFKCVKQFNIPVTEKDDSIECERRALDAWLTTEEDEEDAAAHQLLSLTQESEGAHVKETGDVRKVVKNERAKRTPWTQAEHELFLKGLETYGRGNWKQISRALVTTRSPQQVASHAQKHFKSQHKEETVELPHSVKRQSTDSVTTPAKKPKQIIEDSANVSAPRHAFEPGQMVWARVGKNDWWPGTIKECCEDGRYTVRYYDPFGYTTPKIPFKNIELYSESDENHLKRRCSRLHSKLFNETVASARRAFKKST